MEVNTLLSLPQVAKVLGMNLPAVRLLIRRGALQCAPDFKRNKKVAISQVNDYLARCGSNVVIPQPTMHIVPAIELVEEDE